MIGDGDCCAVCIEPYRPSEVVRILPCRHEFHKSCVDPWLLEHRTCPMCKMDILKHYGFLVSDETIIPHLYDTNRGEGQSKSRRTKNTKRISISCFFFYILFAEYAKSLDFHTAFLGTSAFRFSIRLSATGLLLF